MEFPDLNKAVGSSASLASKKFELIKAIRARYDCGLYQAKLVAEFLDKEMITQSFLIKD